MRIAPSVGSGTVLPAAKTVKAKKKSSKISSNARANRADSERDAAIVKSAAREIVAALTKDPDLRRLFRTALADDLPTPAPAATVRTAGTPLDGLSARYAVKLGNGATDLVRWYCGITHHRPDSVIDGIIQGELEAAKEAYENQHGDDAFNLVLTRVLDVDTRYGQRAELLSDEYGVCVQVEMQAALWLQRFAADVGCPIQDAASAIIVHALESLYNGSRERKTAECVKDWDQWKELGIAARDAFKRREAASARAASST